MKLQYVRMVTFAKLFQYRGEFSTKCCGPLWSSASTAGPEAVSSSESSWTARLASSSAFSCCWVWGSRGGSVFET